MPKSSFKTAPRSPMRVGVYVDGLNLDRGAARLRGNEKPGWRWMDIRQLVQNLLQKQRSWPSTKIERIVLCTAHYDLRDDPSEYYAQDAHLQALRATGSVDQIELGWHVHKVKSSPLATPDNKGHPVLVRATGPVRIKDRGGLPTPNASFVVSHAYTEEKGSDVNVATHLTSDVLLDEVDAVIVISNDSDLGLPVRRARTRVPVGMVNPTSSPLAGALRGDPTDGVGGHWWHRLRSDELRQSQLPDPAVGHTRPVGW